MIHHHLLYHSSSTTIRLVPPLDYTIELIWCFAGSNCHHIHMPHTTHHTPHTIYHIYHLYHIPYRSGRVPGHRKAADCTSHTNVCALASAMTTSLRCVAIRGRTSGRYRYIYRQLSYGYAKRKTPTERQIDLWHIWITNCAAAPLIVVVAVVMTRIIQFLAAPRNQQKLQSNGNAKTNRTHGRKRKAVAGQGNR